MKSGLSRTSALIGAAVAATATVWAVRKAQQGESKWVEVPGDEEPRSAASPDIHFGTTQWFTTSDGVRLFVEVVEPVDRTDDCVTVVLVPGYGIDHTVFAPLVHELRDLDRIVLFDRRGHGESDAGDVASYSLDRLAQDLEEVISEFANADPVVVVAHSLGGMEVLQLAGRSPALFGSLIRGLVLVSTAASVGHQNEFVSARPIGQAVHHLAQPVATMLMMHPEISQPSSASQSLVGALADHYFFGSHSAKQSIQQTVAMLEKVSPDVLAAMVPMFESLDLRAHALALQGVEVAIVVGEQDRVTPASLSLELHELIPQATLTVVPHTGHMVMVEAPDELVAQVRNVINHVQLGDA